MSTVVVSTPSMTPFVDAKLEESWQSDLDRMFTAIEEKWHDAPHSAYRLSVHSNESGIETAVAPASGEISLPVLAVDDAPERPVGSVSLSARSSSSAHVLGQSLLPHPKAEPTSSVPNQPNGRKLKRRTDRASHFPYIHICY
jgi:hypothetical protein